MYAFELKKIKEDHIVVRNENIVFIVIEMVYQCNIVEDM